MFVRTDRLQAAQDRITQLETILALKHEAIIEQREAAKRSIPTIIHEAIVQSKDTELAHLRQRVRDLEERALPFAPAPGLTAEKAYLDEGQEDDEWDRAFQDSELTLQQSRTQAFAMAESPEDKRTAELLLQASGALNPNI